MPYPIGTNPITYISSVKYLIAIAVIGIGILALSEHVTSKNGLKGVATNGMWGYSLLAISVLGLMFEMIGQLNNTINSTIQHKLSTSVTFMIEIMPAFFLFLILFTIIMIISNDYSKINKGEFSGDYYKYSGLLTFTIIIQYALLIYYYVIKKEGKDAWIVTYLNLFFGIFNIIIISMMLIVSRYFTTDG